MRKFGISASFALLGIFLGFGYANAQTWSRYCDEGNNSDTGVISSFAAHISVNIDNSVDVREVIDFIPCGTPRHGIYRDIYLYSSENRKMEIEDIQVADLDGNPYPFTTETDGSNLKIRIGDPGATFTTDRTYVLSYRATNAVAHPGAVDEIYWNVTGNDWILPIEYAVADVYTPAGAAVVQSACYTGPRRSTEPCEIRQDAESGLAYYQTSTALEPGEGLTVAVGFDTGVVAPYKETILDSPYLPWAAGMLLPLLTLILSLSHWRRHGRDPKGTGVIVPQYEVPDGLSPLEVAGIALEKVDGRQIGAEIIYLATEGFIKITELEKAPLGLLKSMDYELTLLKDINETKNDFDRNLLFYLFNTPAPFSLRSLFKKETPRSAGASTVRLSDLKNTFYQYISSIIILVLNSLLAKGYYKNLGRMKTIGMRWMLLVFAAIWGSLFLGGTIGSFLFNDRPVPFMAGIFLSVVIYAIVSHFSPAKTEKGVATKEYLLGLKEYLRIAEKDRLEFHNAPEKKPEVFEKLLPFAMVLGVADIWAREFEGIYTAPPSWYNGNSGALFGAMALSHSMSSFNTFANTSLSSSPGGGSGGGGSSGGGGGGGGGGGW